MLTYDGQPIVNWPTWLVLWQYCAWAYGAENVAPMCKFKKSHESLGNDVDEVDVIMPCGVTDLIENGFKLEFIT